ncbi:MAG: demethoxyubiquinone hydroxylase family protein [Magnetospirillum sp.]
MTAKTAENRIPGDLTREQLLARILRVDQAGELGAVRIYQGQRAILGKGRHGPVLEKMAAQEQHHLDTFTKLIGQRGTRPTVFAPLWHVAGFALGAGTALLGERAAMACTVAVEEAIDEHYAAQYAQLGEDEAELKATIEEFRQEELEHRDIGLANEAEKAPAYPVLSTAIKTGCKLAIWLSERF